MTRLTLRWLLVGVLILWVFFVLASFFSVQKPFSATNALAIGNVLPDLLVAGWLALVALGMGTQFLGWLVGSDRPVGPRLETLVLGTGLGLGILGLLGLGLGLLGLFRPAITYGVTLALSILFARQLGRLFRLLRDWQPANLPGLPPIAYCLLIFLSTMLVSLLPPTDLDGLFYHLTGPKLYLQAGRVAGGVDIPHLNFPSLMEMLYAWAMLLRGDIAAKLLHTWFGLLLAGLVYLTARRLLNKRAAWLSVLVFASMPMVGTLAGWAYNDLALAYYQFASLYAYIKYQITPPTKQQLSQPPNLKAQLYSHRWLVLSGVFAGLGMGLKYTSFVTPMVIVVLIIWHAVRKTQDGFSFKTLASSLPLFILTALLVAVPWYAKNWAFTGNPVYPFLSDLFDGRYWDGFRADWYGDAGSGIGWRPTTLLALPWLLTLGVRDVNYWDGRTGPLFLLFLPLIVLYGLFRYRRNAPDRPLAVDTLLVYTLAQFIFWTLGVVWSRLLWQSRLLLPGLVALAPVVGWLWAELPRFDLPRFSLSRFVNVAVGLTLALTLVDTGLMTLKINPLPYLVGTETRDVYLTRRLGAHYAAMQQINETLPPQAVVLFLWEPRSYYCQRDCRPDSILDEFPHQVDRYGSAEAMARAWRQAGVTHVLIHRSGLDFMLRESPDLLDTVTLTELETHYFRLVFDVAGAYQVYALEPDL